jgi:hypothetical protein
MIKELPICLVCNKPVERVQVYDEAHTDGNVFTIYCHGETERQVITSYQMLNTDKPFILRPFLKLTRQTL